MKACEVIADKNSKKFKLVPILIDQASKTKANEKKEKFTCGSKCCRTNWVKKLVQAKMDAAVPLQSGLENTV